MLIKTRIEVTAMVGTHLRSALEDAVKLSLYNDCPVVLEFNDETRVITRNSDIEKLIAQWGK